MAIPKSAYLMGAVVLGLFGLAIRETASGKARHHDEDDESPRDDDDADSARGRIEYEAARAEAAAQTKKRELAEATAAQLRQLYGAEAASLGDLFFGMTLDEKSLDAIDRRVSEYGNETRSAIRMGNDPSPNVGVVEIQPGERADDDRRTAMCETLDAQLRDAWGRGEPDPAHEGTVWINPATHQRASLAYPQTRCTLRFDRYVDVDQWMNRSATSVIPLALIGQPAQKAAALVGAELDHDELVWRGLGVGAGSTDTNMVATIEGGRVVGITATTRVTEKTGGELAQALDKTLGKSKHTDDGYGGTQAWAGRPAIAVEWEDRGLVLVRIGKTPPP